ncbi:hypothetical protein [Haloferula sp. A504]|uniref:hypothetical protein n=1 Tax=Haloferula sp. A504 TaxID=3373601 RepID=UPI0031C77F95|nr:hypothetical protein [Verrucomicrobiaceae bacterium E54]
MKHPRDWSPNTLNYIALIPAVILIYSLMEGELFVRAAVAILAGFLGPLFLCLASLLCGVLFDHILGQNTAQARTTKGELSGFFRSFIGPFYLVLILCMALPVLPKNRATHREALMDRAIQSLLEDDGPRFSPVSINALKAEMREMDSGE